MTQVVIGKLGLQSVVPSGLRLIHCCLVIGCDIERLLRWVTEVQEHPALLIKLVAAHLQERPVLTQFSAR